MISAGVSSQVAEVRGMALDTIAKMVKAAGPAQIQPHLADLSVTMLESLSGMEVCSWFQCPGFMSCNVPCCLLLALHMKPDCCVHPRRARSWLTYSITDWPTLLCKSLAPFGLWTNQRVRGNTAFAFHSCGGS